MSEIVAVILAGGRGERLWPWSRRRRPKQFLSAPDGKTFLEETWKRISKIAGKGVLITGTDLAPRAGEIITAAGWANTLKVIEEPCGRSTAPAIVLGMRGVSSEDVLIALPADHHIPDGERFREAVSEAVETARNEEIILALGVEPDRPATGYGYIIPGEPLGGRDRVRRIERFVEKPAKEVARKLLAKGALWNAGIFIVRAGVYEGLLEEHLPVWAEFCRRYRTTGSLDGFSECPSISVDRGIMEKSERTGVVRGMFPWDDLGDWEAVRRVRDPDADGNVTASSGFSTLLIDSRNLVLDSDEGLVATIGVEDLVIVRREEILLVMKRGEEQRVKEVLEKLRERGEEKWL